jgi:hypothetical protein
MDRLVPVTRKTAYIVIILQLIISEGVHYA